jgi:hypothetical protein
LKTPEEALEAARARAADSRPAGPGARELPVVERDRAAAGRRLAKWAIVEPDKAQVYSTRRFGAPITWLKRLLIRLLRQYLDQVTAQQSRFNAHSAAYMLALEERIRVLEEARETESGQPPPEAR